MLVRWVVQCQSVMTSQSQHRHSSYVPSSSTRGQVIQRGAADVMLDSPEMKYRCSRSGLSLFRHPLSPCGESLGLPIGTCAVSVCGKRMAAPPPSGAHPSPTVWVTMASIENSLGACWEQTVRMAVLAGRLNSRA